MAIWMEMRCEDRGGDNEDCDSDSNNDPGVLSDEDGKSVAASLSQLKAQAKGWGWKRFKDGWVCEKCAARRKPAPFQP